MITGFFYCQNGHKLRLTLHQLQHANKVICLDCGMVVKDREGLIGIIDPVWKPKSNIPAGWESWTIKE